MRDKARTMPEDIDRRASALRLWHCNYKTLAPLRALSNLRTLVVATYPDTDLEPVASVEGLKYLRLLHLPGVTDLEPLVHLQNLKTLRLATLPSWDSSGKTITVASLAPLAQLPALVHLELFGVRPADRSLCDLEGSSSLMSVRVSKYSKPEVERFYEATGWRDDFAPAPDVAEWS